MTTPTTPIERLHVALQPDCDPERLTDQELATIGVSRTEARNYARWLAGTIEGFRNPLGSEAAITEYLTALDEFNRSGPEVS